MPTYDAALRGTSSGHSFSTRLTRLTNAFSKKLENLQVALALHFASYDFVRPHISLKITPAMAAHVTDHLWTSQDLLAWEAPYSTHTNLN
jgi:hypothetical protein